MNILRHWWLLLLIGIAVGRDGQANQIEGKVVDATDATANIQSTSEILPNVGDPVEIYFAASGVKEKVPVASGKVKEISGKLIVVAIEKSKAKVFSGLNASITASAPRLILCTLMRGGHTKLVLVRDDGIEVKQLTDNVSRDTYAAWSPDGKWIVFSSSDRNGGGLFAINSDGEKFRRLTYGNDTEAAWSPDGRTIIFTHSIRGDLAQLFTIRADKIAVAAPPREGNGSPAANFALKKLSVGTAWDANAAWSPDGKQIAFDSDRSGNWRLYVMDADGKNVRDVSQSDNPGANMYPTWSPNGKRIAYTNSVPDGSRQIFVIDADGKNKKQLTKDGNFNCYATWSPDGKKIAYLSFESAKSKGSLAIMNPDGSEQKIICRDQGTGHNGRPAWKPKSPVE